MDGEREEGRGEDATCVEEGCVVAEKVEGKGEVGEFVVRGSVEGS